MDLSSLPSAEAGMWILQLFCLVWLFGAGLQWHSLWRSEFYLWWILHKKEEPERKREISAFCTRFRRSAGDFVWANLQLEIQICPINQSGHRLSFLFHYDGDDDFLSTKKMIAVTIVCNIMRRKWHSFIVVIWNLKFHLDKSNEKKATFINTHISLIHDGANADLIMNCCWNLHFVIGWLESRVSRAVVSATRSRAINLSCIVL